MWDSVLSIIASILTISSFVFAFTKRPSENKNISQTNIGSTNSITNNNIKVNNSYQQVKYIPNRQNINNTDENWGYIIFISLGMLLSIALFVKFNFIILGLSSILVLLISILTIYRLRKEALGLRSYIYFAIKYISILLIIITCIIYIPSVAERLNEKLSNIDVSNSSNFIASIFKMGQETFLYIKSLHFPSYSAFTLIFRFIAVVIIFMLLFADISKKSFSNAISMLYKNKNSVFLQYFSLFVILLILIVFIHFFYFEDVISNVLDPIYDWFSIK
ncbi:hypothetical protein [Staphylococcus simulans]|uniref:hypothetical protein n=1 Tax=Staphylococcus simulans TaxID=1286 RepID=UPI0028A37BA5|nr:hypothetical protein [Staphylococcus simulans]MDT4012175.1 hypothetical protein [Staphylococcus simulans]